MDRNRFLSPFVHITRALGPNPFKKVRRTSESATHQEGVTFEPAADSFRQGWQEAMSGQTLSISELWQDNQ